MDHNELRFIFTEVLDELDRMQGLVTQAIAILDAEISGSDTSSGDDAKELTLVGKIGRPMYSEKKSFALWEAGLQITTVDGRQEWVSIQTWRKTAIFARDNFAKGSIVIAIGKWKAESWTGKNGEERERQIFVVSHFKVEL